MAYSIDVIRAARQRLESDKADRASLHRERLQEAYMKVPRLREIDRLLQVSMAAAAQAAFAGGRDAVALMEEAKEANLSLQAEKDKLISENFGEDWLLEGPVCRKCGGEGYIGSAMCDCLKAYCREEQVKEVSLLCAGDQSFGNFDLTYYSDRIDTRFGASPRAVMEYNFNICRDYAAKFGAHSGNLLFIGGTGLGKTHLALAMGRAIGEQGCSVCYESAAGLFSKLEKAKFYPSEESLREAKKFESCDLLIIDDLGTEMPGQFVTAALYALLNQRLMAGKAMIVTTNLNAEEMKVRYSPQIASRLQGQFCSLVFLGEDIRVKKQQML